MIEGLELLSQRFSKDQRGFSRKIRLVESFLADELFVSRSGKNVIRGMHFQVEPHLQRKIIAVIEGGIHGVVMDLRNGSRSFLEVFEVDITAESHKAILIPNQCAWGYETLEEENIVIYAIEGEYSKVDERGIRYDSLGVEWRCMQNNASPILNIRDQELPSLERYLEEIK